VQCTKISPEFECQGHRRQKKKKLRHFLRKSSSCARFLCGIFFGSRRRGRCYAGGKISACSPVLKPFVRSRTLRPLNSTNITVVLNKAFVQLFRSHCVMLMKVINDGLKNLLMTNEGHMPPQTLPPRDCCITQPVALTLKC